MQEPTGIQVACTRGVGAGGSDSTYMVTLVALLYVRAALTDLDYGYVHLACNLGDTLFRIEMRVGKTLILVGIHDIHILANQFLEEAVVLVNHVV